MSIQTIEDNELDEQPDLSSHYGVLNKIVESTAKKNYKSLLLEGPAGLGKTYQIQKVMDETIGEANYTTYSGRVTPLKLFELLYQCQEEVLFFDDVKGIFEDESSIELLKAALWPKGNSDKRKVSWESSTKKSEEVIEDTFEFKGSIIMTANDLDEEDEDVAAVMSRCKHYELSFSQHQRKEIIKEIAKAPRNDLDYDERMEVAEWVAENSYEDMEIDLRDLIHCFDLYREHPSMWQEMAYELLDFDKEYVLLKEICEKHDSAGDAKEEYVEKTGNSHGTFYNRKRQFGIEDF